MRKRRKKKKDQKIILEALHHVTLEEFLRIAHATRGSHVTSKSKIASLKNERKKDETNK